jgi:hypothetical protein
MTILLTNSAASLRILGTLNGFATTFSGLGRAIGPAVTGAAFTLGLNLGYVIMPWWLLALIAALGAIPSWFIVDGDGPSGGASASSSTSEDGDDDSEHESLLRDSAVVFDSDEDDDEGQARNRRAASDDVAAAPLLSDASSKTRRYNTVDKDRK